MIMIKRIFLILMIAATMPLLAGAQTSTDPDAQYATELLKGGMEAPNFRMKALDGKDFQLQQLQGKYVVLDFWASWCPDCRKDIPNILRMYQGFSSRGVQFVGVSMDTDAKAWQTAVAKYAIPYLQVSELKKFHDTAVASLYHVKWIPSMYLIGPDGKVILGTVVS